MSNRTDRKAYREALGVVLEAALVGSGKPAQAFEDHLPRSTEFDGRSPFICLASAGSDIDRQTRTLSGKFYIHRINILVFVARADTAAEDALDKCYTYISDTLETNKSYTYWDRLGQSEASFIDPTPDGWGGEPYWVETIPVELRGIAVPDANRISNSTFDSDTLYTKGTGWTISGVAARCSGAQTGVSYLYQVIADQQFGGLIIGTTYNTSVVVTRTAGNVRLKLGTGNGTQRSASGTYTESIACAGNTTFYIEADADFAGTIDTITVEPA